MRQKLPATFLREIEELTVVLPREFVSQTFCENPEAAASQPEALRCCFLGWGLYRKGLLLIRQSTEDDQLVVDNKSWDNLRDWIQDPRYTVTLACRLDKIIQQHGKNPAECRRLCLETLQNFEIETEEVGPRL